MTATRRRPPDQPSAHSAVRCSRPLRAALRSSVKLDLDLVVRFWGNDRRWDPQCHRSSDRRSRAGVRPVRTLTTRGSIAAWSLIPRPRATAVERRVPARAPRVAARRDRFQVASARVRSGPTRWRAPAAPTNRGGGGFSSVPCGPPVMPRPTGRPGSGIETHPYPGGMSGALGILSAIAAGAVGLGGCACCWRVA